MKIQAIFAVAVATFAVAEATVFRGLQEQVVCDPDVISIDNCAGTLELLEAGASTDACNASFEALGRPVCLTCPAETEFSFNPEDPNTCFSYCGTQPVCGTVIGSTLGIKLTPNQGKCIISGGEPLTCINQFPAKQ